MQTWEIRMIAPNGLAHTVRLDPMLVDLSAVGPVEHILHNVRMPLTELYARRGEKNPNEETDDE